MQAVGQNRGDKVREDLVGVDLIQTIHEFHGQVRIRTLLVECEQAYSNQQEQSGNRDGDKPAQHDASPRLSQIATGKHALSEIVIRAKGSERIDEAE